MLPDTYPIDVDPALSEFRPAVRPALAKDLGRRATDYLWDLEQTGWENMETPPVSPCFQANIGQGALKEVIEQFEDHFTDPNDTRNFVFANLLQYAGVRPVDNEAMRWVRLEKEYPPERSFPFATQSLFGRGRLVGIRAVPRSFQGHEQLRTPFLLSSHPDGGVLFTHDDGGEMFPVVHATEQRPLQSAREIVYTREMKQPNGDSRFRMIVNPLISCRERCTFCVRQYDNVGRMDLGAEEPFIRSRLTPGEMARYIFLKYDDLRAASIDSVGLVTGAFDNFDNLYKYIDAFSGALRKETNGRFDPRKHEDQQLFVLSHVITERDQMEAIRELGVKNISHTLEVIDDVRRQRIMPVQSRHARTLNKADITFEQTVASVPHGVEVFGPEGFRVVIIVGLDDLDTTVKGATELHKAGMTALDTSILRAHSAGTMADYAMSFPELMAAKKHMIDLFKPERIR